MTAARFPTPARVPVLSPTSHLHLWKHRMDQSPTSELILNLDQPLNLLALQEALQLLDLARLEIQRQGHPHWLDLIHSVCLRLCYVLERAPVPEVNRAEYSALRRMSQDHLASRLQDSARSQSLLLNH